MSTTRRTLPIVLTVVLVLLALPLLLKASDRGDSASGGPTPSGGTTSGSPGRAVDSSPEVPIESAPTGRTTWESPRTGVDWGIETPVVSADGRWIAFQSASPDIVAGDTNGARDIFVMHATTERLVRVSVASDGTQGDGPSGHVRDPAGTRGVDWDPPAISASGRFVAFQSEATNLVPGDANGAEDVFLVDRDADADGIYDEPGSVSTVRVSVAYDGIEADGPSRSPSLSDCSEGPGENTGLPSNHFVCVVAYASQAPNLVPGGVGTRGLSHIYRSVITSTGPQPVEWLTCGVTGGFDTSPFEGNSASPSISAGGDGVAFSTERTGDGSGLTDIVVTMGGCSPLLAARAVDGGEPDGASSEPVLSFESVEGSGNFRVVYTSEASDLVAPAGRVGGRHVYLSEGACCGTGDFPSTVLVSATNDGTPGDGPSASPAFDPVGGHIAFRTEAPNLLAAGMATGVVVTGPSDGDPPPLAAVVTDPFLAALGPVVATAPFLVPAVGDGVAARLVFASSHRTQPTSGESTLRTRVGLVAVPGDLAAPAELPVMSLPRWSEAVEPDISDDGNWVTFASASANLVPGDANGSADVFVRRVESGEVVRVSVTGDGVERVGGAAQPAISGDGRYVTFASAADLTDEGRAPTMTIDARGEAVVGTGGTDIYVRDRDVDGDGVFDEPGGVATVLVTRGFDASTESDAYAPARSTGWSRSPDITPDGRHVTFESTSQNLLFDAGEGSIVRIGRSPGAVFAHDRDVDANGVYDEALVPTSPPGAAPRTGVRTSVLSRGYRAEVTDPVSGDVRVSPVPPGDAADSRSWEPVISADGRYVAFTSSAENLLPDGAAVRRCVFDPRVGPAPLPADCPWRYDFAFDNDQLDVFVVDRDPQGAGRDAGVLAPDPGAHIRAEIVSVSAAGERLDTGSSSPSIDATGGLVVFVTSSRAVDDEAAELPERVPQVYLRDRARQSGRLVSRHTGGRAADGPSAVPSLSASGRFVGFASVAQNLVDVDPLDVDEAPSEVYVHDLESSRTVLASVGSSGERGVVGDPAAPARGARPAVDAIGRRVAFETNAANFEPTDDDAVVDVYVRTWLPDLVVDPDPVDFGEVDIGSTSDARSSTVENRGFGPARVVSFAVEGPDAARFVSTASAGGCVQPVASVLFQGDTCALASHRFAPVGVADASATLIAGTDDPAIEATASLAGRGRTPTPPCIPGDAACPGPICPRGDVGCPGEGSPASIRVRPRVGPGGRTVTVSGAGFPANATVELRWSKGISTPTQVTTDDAGEFRTRILILPGDLAGPREMRAVSGAGEPATDSFIVVRGSVNAPDFVSRG